MPYTTQQETLLHYTREKVHDLFKKHPVPGHDFEHSRRVAENARKIGIAEKVRDIFLCELAGWLHDIGRVTEQYTQKNKKTHHELSYEMLRMWFRKDQVFDVLTKQEKLELLYAVRYHYNNVADKYDTAWILRDADKLDVFGKIGLKRTIEFYAGSDEKLNMGLRYAFEILYFFHTKTAKNWMKERQRIIPMLNFYRKYLKNKIKPIKL